MTSIGGVMSEASFPDSLFILRVCSSSTSG